MLGSFLLKLRMLFSGFLNSWVGLTLQLRQLLFLRTKKAEKFQPLWLRGVHQGFPLKMTICLGKVPVLGPMGRNVDFVAVVSESWPQWTEFLRPICWTCWGLGSSVWVGLKAMQGDQGDTKPFLLNADVPVDFPGFSVETWIKKYLTLVYIWPFV